MMARPKAGVTFWDRVLERTWFNAGCFEFSGHKDECGYGRIHRGPDLVRIHREAWREANGDPPMGMEICHTCDNPACWNPAHLFLGTHRANMSDMVRKGRAKGLKGEAHPGVKLTKEQVQEIRSIGGLNKDVAIQYGVSKSLISAIRRNEAWSV